MVVLCNSQTVSETESLTIQMKALDKYIITVVLVRHCQPVDENPKCDHSSEISCEYILMKVLVCSYD